jgi:hypothetical protein
MKHRYRHTAVIAAIREVRRAEKAFDKHTGENGNYPTLLAAKQYAVKQLKRAWREYARVNYYG